MGFLGFVLAYSMRFNLSLALVEMVDQSHVLLVNLKSKASAINSSTILGEEHEICSHHLQVILSFNATSLPTNAFNNFTDLTPSLTESKEDGPKSGQNWTSFRDRRFQWTEEEQVIKLILPP